MKTETAILDESLIVQRCVAQMPPAVSEGVQLAATIKKNFEELGV